MIFIISGSKIVYVNRQCESKMGYGRLNFYDGELSFADLVDPRYRSAVARIHSRLLEGGEEPPLDCRLISRNGETLFAIATSRLIDYLGAKAILTIVTDITERRKTERALRESEERYRSLVEESHEILFTLDSEGIIVLLNPAFRRITEWNPDEWLGRPFREFIHPDCRKDFDETFATLRVGEKLPPSEVTALSRSGSAITLEYSGVPIMKDGRFSGAWCLGSNVTARRKAEEDRRNLIALREREGVSRWLHDHLGADLYNIVLLADSIQRKGRVSTEIEQQLGWIIETAREALSSIRNYLDFAGTASGSFTSLVQDIERYGSSILGPLGIDYTFRRRGGLDAVSLTAVQSFNVYLIFKEALTNIIKHARAERVSVLAAVHNGTLSITIDDDGQGLPQGESGQGHGRMNLHARAEELGAHLVVSSIPEGGTRVFLSFGIDH